MAEKGKKAPPKRGRPPAGRGYRESYVPAARLMCRGGAIDADLAKAFGVNVSTVERWKKAHPDFNDACTAGKAIADELVERSLFERATGYAMPAQKFFQHEGTVIVQDYTERYPPDTVACIFWLKNRQPKLWRDKHELDVPGLGDLAEALQAARKRVNGR